MIWHERPSLQEVAAMRTGPIPKGTPRVVEKMERDRAEDKAEREAYAKVDARDQHRCFWPSCKKYAGDHHHVKARSLGGAHTTKNLLSACRRHHDYFKAGLVAVKGNPDRGPVKVSLTTLGREAKIRIPKRKDVAA